MGLVWSPCQCPPPPPAAVGGGGVRLRTGPGPPGGGRKADCTAGPRVHSPLKSGIAWACAVTEAVAVSKRPAKTAENPRTKLSQLIGDRRDPGLGAGVVLVLRRAGAADAADRLFADHDRNAAPQRDDVLEVALRLRHGIVQGTLGPVHGGAPEHARRIGFPARHLGL